jgi:hypothetical protein
MGERRFNAHPKSAPGDFYVVNHGCAACGAPHAVAPDLIGWADDEEYHCIWKKQPENEQELEQAFAAFDASEVECYRYAGDDPRIVARIGPDFSDRCLPPPRPRPMETMRHYQEGPIAATAAFDLGLSVSRPSRLELALKAIGKLIASVFRVRS